jgi:hypothetical protein
MPRRAPVAAAALLVLLGACATAPGPARKGFLPPGDAKAEASTLKDQGGCRPLFMADPEEPGPDDGLRSCWNRVWEVPTAIVVVPVVVVVLVGAATAPVWAPLLFLR